MAATWRPRIEFGAGHAEQALVKAQAASARDSLALSLAAPVVVSKSKKAGVSGRSGAECGFPSPV